MFTLVHTAHAAEGISVKLSPYIVGHIGGAPITATMVTTWLSMVILVVLALVVGKNLKKVPGKLQSVFELIIGGAYQFVESTLESKEHAKKYFPILMTIFLFILAMNWTGLLPGVTSIGFYETHEAAVTETHGEVAHEETKEAIKPHLTPILYPPATDLNLAIAFAFIAMIVIELAGIAALGVFKYGSKFFTFKGHTIGERLLNMLVGIIELISELGRLVSFSFRLFGNIFAGKTLLTVALFFMPLFVPVPILAYEVFVGFIQAGVFAFLTLIFIKLAVAEPHH
jgi:F-type H+-transporting ATPase subunit a